MLPLHLLPNLSPNAAKLYLVLLAHTDPYRNRVTAKIPMTRLIELSGLSQSSCTRALRQLKKFHLLHIPPHRYHAPATYRLLDPALAPKSNSLCTSPETTMSQSPAPPTPNIAPKTQCRSPQTALLNNTSPHSQVAPDHHQLDLRIKQVRAALIAQNDSALARFLREPDPCQQLLDQLTRTLGGNL